MLPAVSDNGARLAAILPSGIAAIAKGIGRSTDEFLPDLPEALPAIRSLVVLVVDGLGHANLKEAAGHARTLSALPTRRIETVVPSTTGAALTSLTTGKLPGEHGLIGYRIRHPEFGLVNTLNEWDGIADGANWQRCTPLFESATALGIRSYAIGRPAHASGGLTGAILSGAEYLGGQRIEDRCAAASRVLRNDDPALVYLYVDELDRAAHEHGWRSERWVRRLEQLDAALDSFVRTLPGGVGLVVTADHGIIDIAPSQQVMLDSRPELMEHVAAVGGEPRLRSLYLHEPADAELVATRWQDAEGARAWVGAREDAIAANWFGPVAESVAPRLGDVLIAARKQVAYYLSDDDPRALAMVGQHGSLSAEERGVPLALGGALAGTGFAATSAAVAKHLVARTG